VRFLSCFFELRCCRHQPDCNFIEGKTFSLSSLRPLLFLLRYYYVEYVPAAYMRRTFISHFKGSAGTAVITQAEAHLWTDSRYWNEATLQLDGEHWTLQKAGLPSTKTISKWLGDKAAEHYGEAKNPLKVGIDPFVHAASFAKEVEDAFKESASTELGIGTDDDTRIGQLVTSLPNNLIDEIWADERPPIPTSPFRVHPIEYAGLSVADKVSKIREQMKEKKATMAVFTTLDDVAYLFNVRTTGDVECNPVGIAYAVVTTDDVKLYCDPRKVQSDDVKAHLSEVMIMPYDAIIEDVKAHCETNGSKVWLDKTKTNYGLSSLVPDKAVVDAQTAITAMKACKNFAELDGMRRAHEVDGVAMAKFMAWLEDAIVNQGRTVSEVEIDKKLTGYRAEQPGFIEVSFPTIAGVGSNGAIIHYRASEESELMKYLDKGSPILIDSGGQYSYGTTDVTRTWHFGTPTPEFVNWYTRVLKGHIGLDEMIFPENTPGFALDVYARRWLWDAGKDYGHGTGHGVGAALNVHEGPQSISPRWANKEGLKNGMVVSNEPGYYEDGNFGIRIENLLEIQYVNPEDAVEGEEKEGSKSGDKKFLRFAKLTLIPIQKNLIDVGLMTNRELDWLDAYHEEVFNKISPHLDIDSPEMEWLKKSCEKIDRQGQFV